MTSTINRFQWRCFSIAALLAMLPGCATILPAPAPGYPEYMAAAEVAAQENMPEAALQAYRQAASADPASKEPWQHIALLHAEAGQPEAALLACQEVLRRDPADMEAGELFIDSGLQIAQETVRRLHATGAVQVESRREQGEALLAQMIEVFGEKAIPAAVLDRHAKKAIQAYRARLRQPSAPAPGMPLPDQPVADPLDVLGVK